MVRSRSETNLNRIFIDLCTSPEIRRKHGHQPNDQRQYHPPLPVLQPIKSNSCSNINELASNLTETSSAESVPTEKRDALDLTSLSPIPLTRKKSESCAVPLVPMESTGFTVQPTPSNPRPLTLFETLSINHLKKPLTNEENQKNKCTSLPSNASTVSQDWKQQDFLSRLQNRLKSRRHLRTLFLS
jgi:hypothetical protein